MSGRGRLQYGLLEDENRILRWLDYPPATGRYITRRVPVLARAVPTIETHGRALW